MPTTGLIVAMFVLGVSALVLLLIGVGLGLKAVRQLRLVRASRNWPSVQGEIVSTDIREEVRKTKDENKSAIYYIYYRPEVRYKYEVGMTGYSSSQRMFGDPPSYAKRDEAQDILEKYLVGQPIQVYYDPADPGNGVLEPGKIDGITGGLVSSVLCIGLALFLVQIAFRLLSVS